MRSTRKTFWISLAIVVVVMAVTALPLCGWMFRCGCSFAHGAEMCNIHHEGMAHCPWCVKSGMAFGVSFLAVIPVAGGVIFVAARRGKAVWVCCLAGGGAYFVAAVAAGWVTAKVMGYGMWFGWV